MGTYLFRLLYLWFLDFLVVNNLFAHNLAEFWVKTKNVMFYRSKKYVENTLFIYRQILPENGSIQSKGDQKGERRAI